MDKQRIWVYWQLLKIFKLCVILTSGGSRILMGTPTPKVGLFCNIFSENCMKMNEFGPPGCVLGAPLGSANDNGQRNLWLFVEMYSLLRQVSPCSSLSIMPLFRASNALLVGAKTVNCPFSLRTEFRPTRPITVTVWFTNPRIIVRFLSWQLERQRTHQLNLVTCNACCHCFWK